MIPQRWIESYLRFLLTYRWSVSLVVLAITAFFSWNLLGMRLNTDFNDFYPRYRTYADAFTACRASGENNFGGCLVQSVLRPGPDPYIQIYRDFRRMFGVANILAIVVETKQGHIFNPDTLQKIDRLTKAVTEMKGVVPYQIFSIAHPKLKSITTRAGSIQFREIFYPGVPQTQEDADRVRFAVYATPGVRGLFTSLDDSAALVAAGFWEEALDFREMSERINALVAKETDANHTIYVTGLPWLYTSVLEYANQVVVVFGCIAVTLAFLLYVYFRTWTGIWVPMFSALLSCVWGLGIAVALGFNLDPMVLVIPVFLTARTISHSVQSMDRYHEEYYKSGSKETAIIESYSHLFPPAIAAIVTDGIGLLIVAVAPIPLIQKISLFASFWVVSIFISVVTLHPIILSFTQPPPLDHAQHLPHQYPSALGWGVLALSCVIGYGLHATGVTTTPVALGIALIGIAWVWWFFSDRIYPLVTHWVILASEGNRRWFVIAFSIVLTLATWSYGRTLKVGDMTPGAALLFPHHPFNVAYTKWNEKFLGANQLIVIADAKRPDGIKNPVPLSTMQEFAYHMERANGATTSVTVIEIVKQVARLFREGDPKWGLIPEQPKEIGQLFFVFTQNASVGDLDRFIDPSGRYGTILTTFRGYSHQIIMDSIRHGEAFAREHGSSEVEFKFAGGLFGILAAVNQAVEHSYWTNLVLIWISIYICLYLTYGSHMASAILMIPVVTSQFIAEALMVFWRIDLNVNSLPIAAAGAGAGVDYGIYHFSRMIDTFDEIGKLDEAVDYATQTTGKAIIFTASTMVAATIYFWFSDLKFLAEMGLLLAVLMIFNTFGGLVVVPAFVKVIRPGFLLNRVPHPVAPEQRAVAG
jgi:predicted RND superfamily exporter protein